MKKLYIVRHCEAEGQEQEAPLTPTGRKQAEALADFLEPLNIDRIVSSPFLRALQSIEPLAIRIDEQMYLDDRLAERKLCDREIDDWLEKLKASFEDMDICLEGGESSNEAMDRVVEALEESIRTKDEHIVFVLHGNIMALLLKHFDPSFGFKEWKQLSNPDVFEVQLENGNASVSRIWNKR
ncbi:histidine phosphatase family protein [Pseudalkalibacillus caeni]|uniref:Histidine phosphatase family protein n=1 Tax=Exobacillus caeni TaxID=2574798 RepID=A0A5R9F715_9BACL|nr:histidine phosphatase family protein [Pseudalkalibacillus caeni]TLS38136.1 histidine phosphatase family protein [Pseudalkalibacillus caeni]